MYRNIEMRSRSHSWRGKAVSNKSYERVSVALVIQHAKRMHHSTLYSVACLAGTIFFLDYLINATILEEKGWWTRNMCFGFLCNFPSETFVILRRIQRDFIINVHRFSFKVLARYSSQILMTAIFSTDFRKTLRYQISRKCIWWEPSCEVRTDRRTDMTKLIIVLRNPANALRNWSLDNISCTLRRWAGTAQSV